MSTEITPFERKRLGAYYTPEILSQILTDWAIVSPTDNVLEPSFGRCGFLAAARRRLERLGCNSPAKQIFGCDVDPGAFMFLGEALRGPINANQFIQHDFLRLDPKRDWPQLFDTIIGNPPYIPFQLIPEAQRHELMRQSANLGAPVGGRASLWAYFIIHAVSFVATGGRMALVLPGAFLQADYAAPVREYLSRAFNNVLCVLMHQRFFKGEGTEEETAILIAKNRQDKKDGCDIEFDSADSPGALSEVINNWEAGLWSGRILSARPAYLAVEGPALHDYEAVQAWECCHTLGLFLRVTIGLVTGANSFFVLNEEERKRLSLTNADVVPILGKFKMARGLSFTKEDHTSAIETGGRCHLVHSKVIPLESSALRQYLTTFSEEKRSKVRTFKKRSVWHAPDDEKIPNAFLPVMSHEGPRLVLNDAKMNCTNSVHRASFIKHLTVSEKKLLAISSLSSFSQLSAEVVGRRYGSGVLKHEPREAEKIAILFPENISEHTVNTSFKKIDGLLRAGENQKAREHADALVLYSMPGGTRLADTFSATLSVIRDLRRSKKYIATF